MAIHCQVERISPVRFNYQDGIYIALRRRARGERCTLAKKGITSSTVSTETRKRRSHFDRELASEPEWGPAEVREWKRTLFGVLYLFQGSGSTDRKKGREQTNATGSEGQVEYTVDEAHVVLSHVRQGKRQQRCRQSSEDLVTEENSLNSCMHRSVLQSTTISEEI